MSGNKAEARVKGIQMVVISGQNEFGRDEDARSGCRMDRGGGIDKWDRDKEVLNKSMRGLCSTRDLRYGA